jgi:cytochrome b6-f complex iron-sulfur subunit
MEKTPTVVQSRREFCLCACKVGSLIAFSGSLATLLASCEEHPAEPDPGGGNGGGLPVIQATASNSAIVLTIDSESPLAAVGSAAAVQYSGGRILVARVAEESFQAVTAVCTHEGCTITGYDNLVYMCPCHGSRFATNGQVVQGPALTALRTYQTQFANGQLTIRL